MRYITFVFLILAASPVLAVSQAVQHELKNPIRIGQGKLTYYFWDVYNATLYAPNGQWQQDEAFALTFEYLRDFKSTEIAERSAKEMKEQGVSNEKVLADWRKKMEKIFPDVKHGDVLTGIVSDKGYTRFFYNDSFIGEIKDKAFSQRFFNIWLAKNTSEPELRENLLGDFN